MSSQIYGDSNKENVSHKEHQEHASQTVEEYYVVNLEVWCLQDFEEIP